MMTISVPLVPRNGNGPLRPLIIGRISTINQDPENIAASYRVADEFLRQNFSGPVMPKYLGEQASGMLADRQTFLEAEELIEAGAVDLVLAEDLSRIHRNPRYQWAFVQNCIDARTRLICLAEGLDTAIGNWHLLLGVASIVAGAAVPEAQRRVRRTANHTFHKGGMVQKVKFGYRKLSKEEAASGKFGPVGLELAKTPEHTPIIREMRAKVLQRSSPDRIADWLIDEAVRPGHYVKSGRWTGRLVEELLRDPILSGTRTFRDTIYEQVLRSGKHRRNQNPCPETEYHPELAHMTLEEQSEMIAVLDARRNGRDFPAGPDHPSWHRPRSESLWPGQHARCANCGGRFYRYGKFLKCQNALSKGPRTCWNHVQVDIETARRKVLPWVVGELGRFPEFRSAMVQAAWNEYRKVRRRQRSSGDCILQCIKQLEVQASRLAAAIRKGGEMEALVGELQTVDKNLQDARAEKANLETQSQDTSGFDTPDAIADRLDEAIFHLAETSFEFADLFRRLLPVFVIQPVQALDCAQVRPRAKLTMHFDEWSDQGNVPPPISVALDLFQYPVHVEHLAACVSAKKATPDASLDTIADKLGINRMTVKRALAYARRMEESNLDNPYRELVQQPKQASRWKGTGSERT